MGSGSGKKPKPTLTKPPTFEQRKEKGGQVFRADADDCDDFLQPFERAFIVADFTVHRLFGQALEPPDWFSDTFSDAYPAYQFVSWEVALSEGAPFLAVEYLFDTYCQEVLSNKPSAFTLIKEEQAVRSLIVSFVADWRPKELKGWADKDWSEQIQTESEDEEE
jgi:hypothetical protein